MVTLAVQDSSARWMKGMGRVGTTGHQVMATLSVSLSEARGSESWISEKNYSGFRKQEQKISEVGAYMELIRYGKEARVCWS